MPCQPQKFLMYLFSELNYCKTLKLLTPVLSVIIHIPTVTSMISLICKYVVSSLFKIPGWFLKSQTVKLKLLNWNYIPGSSWFVHYLLFYTSLSLSHSLVVLTPCKMPCFQMILQQYIHCFFFLKCFTQPFFPWKNSYWDLKTRLNSHLLPSSPCELKTFLCIVIFTPYGPIF